MEIASDARAADLPVWRSCALALGLAVALCFAGIGCHALWSPDEPTGAAVGRAMLESGDLIVPRLNGEPFLEKPPLYWWVQVAAFRLFGVSDTTARIPSALFGVLGLLTAWALGRLWGTERQGLLAVCVLGTTLLFLCNVGRVIVDPALLFFVALAHLGFALVAAPRSSRDARGARWLIAVALALAFLVKGVVAVGLGAGPPVIYLLLTRRRMAWQDLRLLVLPCLLSLGLLVVPWAVALQHAGGWAALRECLLSNTAGRFASTAQTRRYGHSQPFYYYLEVGPPLLLPWILALPAMLRAGAFRGGARGGEARRLFLAAAGLGVLLLSAAATKREIYLLPLLPAWSAAVAWWLARIAEQGPGDTWDRRTLKSLAGFAVLLPLLLGTAALAMAWSPRVLRGLATLRGAVTPGRLAVYGLSALALAVLTAVFLSRGPRVGRLAAALVLVTLSLETGLLALVDPAKRMTEMTSAVAMNFPGTGPIPVYLPVGSNESVYGILEFELGRRTLALKTPDELAAWTRVHPGAPVLFRMRQARRLPADVLRGLRFVYDETGRKASPFGIAVAASGSPTGPDTAISKTQS
ncbi:MAG TPA: glycosyltransferase family 39 protein [Thermoanaerobaculia bacterium]